MEFLTSDIQVLATVTYKSGITEVTKIRIRSSKRGLFKEEIERRILQNTNIVKVRVH